MDNSNEVLEWTSAFAASSPDEGIQLIQLEVKLLEKIVSLSVNQSDSVESVLAQLRDQEGISGNVELFLGDMVLFHSLPLSAYGIGPSAVLRLETRQDELCSCKLFLAADGKCHGFSRYAIPVLCANCTIVSHVTSSGCLRIGRCVWWSVLAQRCA